MELANNTLDYINYASAAGGALAVVVANTCSNVSVNRYKRSYNSEAQLEVNRVADDVAFDHAVLVPGLSEILLLSNIEPVLQPERTITIESTRKNRVLGTGLLAGAIACAAWAGLGGPIIEKTKHSSEGTVVFLVDQSGSSAIRDILQPNGSSITRMAAIQEAAKEFAVHKPTNLEVRVVGFSDNENSTQVVQTKNAQELVAGVEALKVHPKANTDLSGAIISTKITAEQLYDKAPTKPINKNDTTKSLQQKQAVLDIVVLTDGANNGSRTMREVPGALKGKVRVNMLIMSPEDKKNPRSQKDRELARLVTNKTGGDFIDIATTSKDKGASVKEITKIFDRIARRNTRSTERSNLWYAPAAAAIGLFGLSRRVKWPKK